MINFMCSTFHCDEVFCALLPQVKARKGGDSTPENACKKMENLIERLLLVLFDWFRIIDRSIQVEENPHKPLDFSKG